ncbi:MAG: hypothetical protein ACFB4I_03615 [Cyanophyceae cyanobacterium]
MIKYRSVSYKDNSPKLAQGDIKATGKHRGVDLAFSGTGQAAPQLDAGETSRASRPPAVSSIQERSRRLMMKHHRAIKRRELTMLSRLASEVGLQADVSCYCNRIQGEFPSGFAATYDRSPAAMS